MRKAKGGNGKSPSKKEEEKKDEPSPEAINTEGMSRKERKRAEMLEELNKNDIVVTYEQKRGGLHANTRDINVSGVTVAFHGKPLVEETDVVINYGNRYGLIGPNG